MREFARKPSRNERIAAIIINLALLALFSAICVLLFIRNALAPAVVCGALATVFFVLFYRAAFGTSRALKRRETHAFAWVLLALGSAGLVAALFLKGQANHRFMLLGGAVTMFGAGLAGVRSRGSDA